MENTKVISCRMPFNEYIELLKKVNDKGLNVNDFLLSKVFCEPESEREKIQELEMDCAEKLEQITELQNEIEGLKSELSYQEKIIIELQTKEKKQAQQLAQALQDCQIKDKNLQEKTNLYKSQSIDYQQFKEKIDQEKSDLLVKIKYLNEQIRKLTLEKQQEISVLQNELQESQAMCESYEEKSHKKDRSKSRELERLNEEFDYKKASLQKEYTDKLERLETKSKADKLKLKADLQQVIDNFKVGSWDNFGKKANDLKTELLARLG